MRPQNTRRRSAFTLVEVLATLVLMGIVIPVAMHGVSIAMAAASNARKTAEAATLAEAKLNELVATREWEFGAGSGDFGAHWPEYKWTLATATREYEMTELVLSVTWQDRGKERSVAVSTLSALPGAETDPFGMGAFP